MTFVVDFPAGSGSFPAIVIAPGLRYAVHRELFSLLADKAVAAGFAVCRFNWRFYESDPLACQPSSALQDELEQLKEVIEQLRAESRVLPAQVHGVGKSFGSIVAWQALRDDAELKSGVLRHPCSMKCRMGSHAMLPTHITRVCSQNPALCRSSAATMILIAGLLACAVLWIRLQQISP